jgi:enoyl-CoA hydratase/carnithine racemase
MEFEHILVERSGDFATVTMNRPQRRNALSLEHMRELIAAFRDLGDGDALGIVLAGNGPVFSAGHDGAAAVRGAVLLPGSIDRGEPQRAVPPLDRDHPLAAPVPGRPPDRHRPAVGPLLAVISSPYCIRPHVLPI